VESINVINIKRQEECSGCSACVDICGNKAIELKTDIEGFWYPVVNQELCINCGLCEKTCPQLHVDDLKYSQKEEPIVYAAYHKDYELRRESTSGGLFSALANEMYDRGGYVGGAVYTREFAAKHIVSKNREDLIRIRGSKYFQSDMTCSFKQIEELLIEGEKVLVCGAPCQIAGLRLYLRKEYEKLVTVDFICLGINSPKIFRKYLESLERQYKAKVISVQAKNKDLGWRSLAIKIIFSNGRTYLREGHKDDFTRGFIEAHCYCRPVCYKCKYKGFPRISDITLGDFWGIEKFERAMDDNMGTSAVLLNTQKGIAYFESIKNKIVSKEVPLCDVLPGNLALMSSVALPTINRCQYYEDVDKLSFDAVAKKYYSSNGKLSTKVRKRLGSIGRMFVQMGFHPKPYMQFLLINILRKNTRSKARKGLLIFPGRYVVIYIHKQAQIAIKGTMLIGYRRIRSSRMETRFAIEGNGALKIEKGSIVIYYGTEIHIFNGGMLTFAGNATINQRVQIICMDNITIGNDVIIARDVVIRDNDGGHEILATGYKKTAPVTIGNHVWIGQGAMIMKGVTIGDGAVIGAGAWVAKDVKPNTLVLGDPARAVQKDIKWKC
jgi:acetyltransferase-like isoleucine patch superfamily enzyme/coenzyme F420-reducing hydrogenase beta subunit